MERTPEVLSEILGRMRECRKEIPQVPSFKEVNWEAPPDEHGPLFQLSFWQLLSSAASLRRQKAPNS